MYDVFSLKDFSFPKDFIWGAGYAGHQVEGNNVNSQWWHNEIKYDYDEKSGAACNSYELFREDIDLSANLGHGAFRTSVEWSRVEPVEGEFCDEAVEHYVALFAGLKEKGIKVFATMLHFALPQWFDEKGNFNKEENVKYFERYLEYVVPKIAPFVDYWNVMNEFNLHSDFEWKTNSLLAHARGYHVIKQYSDAPISTAHALVQYHPCRPNDRFDRAAAEQEDLKNNEFFFHAIRTGEIVLPGRDVVYSDEVKGAADFWSINTYVRHFVDARKANLKGDHYPFSHIKMINKDFYLEEINPECVIHNLTRLMDKPVIITENGCSCDDDRFRIVWIATYLSAVAECIKMGVDVRGYLYWSLLDNYEWGSFVPKFGMCACDRETFERTPKPSAYFYKEIIENNGFNQEILRKYLNELPTLLGGL